MKIPQIVLYPDRRLLTQSMRVTHEESDLFYLLEEVLHRYKRAHGISAPQIGIPLRAFIIKTSGLFLRVINPVIVDMKGESSRIEKCLSIPGFSKKIKRATYIRYYSQITYDSTYEEYELAGYDARIFQHEYDHKEGILINKEV